MATIKVLAERQLDGSINQFEDCVPDVIDMGVAAVTGNKEHGGAWWKNAVYGVRYTGGTAAIAYIEVARQQGANLFAIDNNANAQLVQDIHSQIQQGHPVVATEPDPYEPQPNSDSHVLLFYSEAPGELSVIDPFYGQIITKKDNEWQSILEFHEIWGMSAIKGEIPVPNTNIPTGWSLSKDKKTLTAPNGMPVYMGFAQRILSDSSWVPSNVPLDKEFGDGYGGTEQWFMNNVLRWNPQHGVTVDSLGSVVIEQQSQVKALLSVQDGYKATIATLQTQLKAVQAGVPAEIVAALVAAQHSAADLTQAIQAALNVPIVQSTK